MQPGARQISPEHVRRLRELVAREGNVTATARLAKMSPEIVEDGLTGKIFRPKTAASIEAKIDLASRGETEAPSTDPR